MSSEESDGSQTDESNSSNVSSCESVVPLSTSQLRSSELRKVLKESQLGHQRLAVKYKDLRTKYEALKASTKSAKVKNGRKPLSADDKAIALAGGRFAFAYELWVDGSALDRERPNGVDPLNKNRYSTSSAQELAITAEVYASLPSHLQDALMSDRRRPSFKKTFLQQVKQERANIVYTARSIAGELFGFNPTYFRSKFDRATIPELQELLHRDERPDEKYHALAPMLFPGRDPKNKNPLAVEEFAKFLRTILHGVSSLNGGDPTGRRAPKASLWGISKTTPGMIALAATVLTFVCGPDQIFSDKSKGPTGINWSQRFQFYKKLILRFPPPYYASLLSWYDSQIFRTSASAPASSASLPVEQQDINDVDDLIEGMGSSDVVHVDLLSPIRSDHRLSPAPFSRNGSPAAPEAIDPHHSSPAAPEAMDPHRSSPASSNHGSTPAADTTMAARRQSTTRLLTSPRGSGSGSETNAAGENVPSRESTPAPAEEDVQADVPQTRGRASKGKRAKASRARVTRSRSAKAKGRI